MQTSVPLSDESNDTDIDEDRLEKRGLICIIRPVIRSSSSALTILYTHIYIHITSFAYTYIHTYIHTYKRANKYLCTDVCTNISCIRHFCCVCTCSSLKHAMFVLL
jgi:hypothetical protein